MVADSFVDVDTGQRDDLGPVGGNAGSWSHLMEAACCSPTRARTSSSATTSTLRCRPRTNKTTAKETARATRRPRHQELIFLESGVRVPINDQLSLWKWSRTGDTILLLQPGLSTGIWQVVSEDGVRDLGDAPLSQTFLRDYVFFAWQYVESPRLWSPDGDAIVYGSSDRGIPACTSSPSTVNAVGSGAVTSPSGPRTAGPGIVAGVSAPGGPSIALPLCGNHGVQWRASCSCWSWRWPQPAVRMRMLR